MNGKFKQVATTLQQNFPGLKIEHGPYTPPVSVQYAIRAVRVGQLGAAVAYFFGEQLFSSLRLTPPSLLRSMHENPMLTVAGVYGLDVIAQMLKSINAFEITYNGRCSLSRLWECAPHWSTL